jgi:hypothetical protein
MDIEQWMDKVDRYVTIDDFEGEFLDVEAFASIKLVGDLGQKAELLPSQEVVLLKKLERYAGGPLYLDSNADLSQASTLLHRCLCPPRCTPISLPIPSQIITIVTG